MVVVVEFEPRWLMKGLKRALYKTFNDLVKDFAKKFQNPFNYILDAFAKLFNGFLSMDFPKEYRKSRLRNGTDGPKQKVLNRSS